MKRTINGLLLTAALSTALMLGGCQSSDVVKTVAGTTTVENENSAEESTTETETSEARESEEPETDSEKESPDTTEESPESTAEAPSQEEIELEAGANMDEAPEIPLETVILGQVDSRGNGGWILWYTFTTGDTSTYEIALGKDSENLTLYLIDIKGNELYSQKANSGGFTTFIDVELEPSTKYYLRLTTENWKGADYSLSISPIDADAISADAAAAVIAGKNTADTGNAISFGATEKSTVTDTTDIRGGTNMNDAVLLPLETRLYGTYKNSEAMWFAFTTTSTENATYRLTAVNKTKGSKKLYAAVYNENGDRLGDWTADEGGGFSTKDFKLDPNTVYYFYVNGKDNHKDTINYMLIIREADKPTTAYQTTDSFSEARGLSGALEGTIYPAFNADDAALLPLNLQFSGKVQDASNSWFAFTTNSAENATYSFSAVNMSTGTKNLIIGIYDQYGTRIGDWSAGQDGKTSTKEYRLDPLTTYYLLFHCKDWGSDTINYTFIINAPEDETLEAVTIGETTEDALVFETPFELNETQVMFVKNEAAFINEAAAKAAVAPVAEAILAHPDHSILIAGTTATDGSHESCLELSNHRAEAVKNLLVAEYGVPESQIQTIGLGYAVDPFERGQDREIAGDITSKFIESEGAKNRRVVIMDLESAIAQEILAAN
ncbi:MAG: OmpA family protein [Clostridiales bacterium]|nr:OmpA family protein [Clostridiales bacterium]